MGKVIEVTRILIWLITGFGAAPYDDEFQWPEEDENDDICPFCGRKFSYYNKDHRCLFLDLHGK